MKKLIIFILYLISRVIYSLIPKEFKKKKIYMIYIQKLLNILVMKHLSILKMI